MNIITTKWFISHTGSGTKADSSAIYSRCHVGTDFQLVTSHVTAKA